MGLALLLCLLQGPALPQTPEAMAQLLGVKAKAVHRSEAPGLELWCDEDEGFAEADEPARKAWSLAQEWLGAQPMPEGMRAQVFILHGKERLTALMGAFQAQCTAAKVSAPGPEFLKAVVDAGSGLWSNPPAVWINGQILHKDDLATRVVHDLGAIAARYAVSPYGNEPPEFLEEGFAAMLMRHALKRPSALVSHKGAAQASTLYGYGVFSGISGAANDYSNAPGNWPGILRAAVQKMRKEETIEPKSMVDQLLLRSEAEWARTDYAYGWSVIEFLFDPGEPYGAAATGDPKHVHSDKPLEQSRRSVIVKVLADLRENDAGMDAKAKAEQLREQVLDAYGETAEQLHAAFMGWVENSMPKK